MFHTWNISNSSSLSMYHRLRTMAYTTEDPTFSGLVDVRVDMAENVSLEEMSWTQDLDPGTWMPSQEVAGLNTTIASINSKLDKIIAEREPSDNTVAKRVSCGPPLCSFLSSLLMMLFSLSPEKVQQKSVGLCIR